MKRILLNFLFLTLILFTIIYCKKENETVEEENVYDTYVKGNTNNIYHSKYSNVVKIQGRYVEKTNNSFYLTLGGREEGRYDENYNIFDAIRNGSLQRVAEIIEADNSQIEAELDNDEEYNEFKNYYYTIDGVNPLSLAVFYRDIGIVQYLLDNINDESVLLHRDEDGWNAFAYACAFGTLDIIKALIQKYPDFVNWENSYGANGLHMAVLHGNISVFDYLVNDRDMGIIQYLLDNINDESVLLHRDEDGWNAFAYACAFGTVDIIKALIQKYPDFVNWKNPQGANGLHMAALYGNISVFDYLVNDLKIDINSTNDEGKGVLYYAKDNDLKIDINSTNYEGKGVLYFANDEKTEEALIKLGAKRDYDDYEEDEEVY